MINKEICEICRRNGVQSHLQAYQINLNEAIYLCENSKCSYPVGLAKDSVTFSRSLADIPTQKQKDVAPKVPSAQMALQNQAATQLVSHGHKMQRGVTATQTSRPSSMDFLQKQRNGIVPLNGSLNGHQSQNSSDGVLQNKQSKSASQNRNCSHSNSISPNFTAFQFGRNSSRPVAQQHKLQPASSVIPPYMETHQNGVSSVYTSATASSQSEISSNVSYLSESTDISHQVQNGQTSFEHFDLKSAKSITTNTDALLCQTAKMLDAIATNGISLTDTNSFQGNGAAVPNTDIDHQVDLMAKNVARSSVDGFSNSKSSDNALQKYPNILLQWKNKDALCWLDVVLCLLVHNKILQSSVKKDTFDKSSIIYKLITAQQQAQTILLSLQERTIPDMKCASLDKLFQANRLTKNFSGYRRRHSRTLTVVSPSGTDGVNIKTGAGRDINTKTEDSVTYASHSPVTEATELDEAESILNSVRESIWELLKPSLKCEKGQNDSPVFAFPLLLRDNPVIEDLFKLKGKYIYKCGCCGLYESNEVQKIIPTLPAVMKDFDINKPAHKRKCPRCGKQEKRWLVYDRLAPCLLMHFLDGLPHKQWQKLAFEFGGQQYAVTGVIQYKNNPDHFIAWLRDPTSGQWMKCDDLASPVTVFQSKLPPFPAKQVHIVMWEAVLPTKVLTVPTSISGGISVAATSSNTSNVTDKSYSMKSIGISSASSICSEMSECQDLPEFVSTLPPVGIPVVCEMKPVTMTESVNQPCVSDIRSRDQSLSIAPSNLPILVHKPQPIKVVAPNELKSNEDGCAITVHPGLAGQVSVIKPSSVFTAPSKEKEATKQSVLDTSGTCSTETVKFKSAVTLVKGPVQKLDQALSPGLLPEKQCQFKVMFAKTSEQSQSINSSTICMGNTKTSTSDIPKGLQNIGIPSSEKKQENSLNNFKRTSIAQQMANTVTVTPSQSQMTLQNLQICVIPDFTTNQAQIQNDILPSTSLSDRVSCDSSVGIQHSQTGKPSSTKETASSSAFKHPANSMRLLRSLKTCSSTKNTGASLSKDAFKTMKFSKSKCISPNSSSGSSPASSNVSTPSSSPLLSPGNLNYLSAVKQYLLNKTTTNVGSQFKGMSLKSKSSDDFLNLTNDLSETVSCSKYTKRILNQSEYFGRKASSPNQSTMSDNLLQRKRKSDNEFDAPACKKAIQQGDKTRDDFQDENLQLSKIVCHNIESSFLNSEFTKLRDGGNNLEVKNPSSDSPSPQKSETSSTDREDILQELYQALDIPMDTVGDTMSHIMTDVDDILNIVQSTASHTGTFSGLVLGQGLNTSPVMAPNFEYADTDVPVVSQAVTIAGRVGKGRYDL